jgi:hypothetical protein
LIITFIRVIKRRMRSALVLAAVCQLAALARADCYRTGRLRIEFPSTWISGRYPESFETEVDLVSPFSELGNYVEIKITEYPDAGDLDHFVATREARLHESEVLHERVLSRRRFSKGSIKLAETQSESEQMKRRFVTWYTVVDGTGYMFAGFSSSSSFARHLSTFRSVLDTLSIVSTAGCATPLTHLEIPPAQRVGSDDHVWLTSAALDAKLDFESEMRRRSSDGVCEIKIQPMGGTRFRPARLELTARCTSATATRSIENRP